MFIHRLQVKGSLTVDVTFSKINVILGRNKKGKTTLVKLLLYGLGVHIENFIDEISNMNLCKQVELDVLCNNGKKYRIVRQLPASDSAIVYPLDDAGIARDTDTNIHTLSELSDFLLQENGYDVEPIVYGKSHKASFRFYFLLRAVLIDQDTSILKYLADLGGQDKEYLNNQQQIIKSIIEAMLGEDNAELQRTRFQLQDLYTERTKINTQLALIDEMLKKHLNDKKKLEGVSIKTAVLKSKIEELSNERKKLSNLHSEQAARLQSALQLSGERISKLEQIDLEYSEKLTDLNLERIDVVNTKKSLEEELEQLQSMLVARQVLLNTPIQNCPVCLALLKVKSAEDEKKCSYCGNEVTGENIEQRLQFKRMLAEALIEAKDLEEKIKKDIVKLEQERQVVGNELVKLKEAYFKNLDSGKGPIQELIASINYQLEAIHKQEEVFSAILNLLEKQDEFFEKRKSNNQDIAAFREDLNRFETQNTVNDTGLIQEWSTLFNHLLKEVFGDIGNAHIDYNYAPIVDGKELAQVSSASLKVATRLCYIYSLFKLASVKPISHLGFVIFDSPKDKDLDLDKYERFIKAIECDPNGQIFLTGSIFEKKLYDPQHILLELENEDAYLLHKSS